MDDNFDWKVAHLGALPPSKDEIYGDEVQYESTKALAYYTNEI